jgi:lysophospholipase L1-like esterase
MSLLTVTQSKVAIIGDSMFSESPVQSYLENWSGCKISNYAITGASLQDGWVESIPSQYVDIENQNFSTIIMDGGGNDVMSKLSECQEFNENCKLMINYIVNIAESLINKMGRNNVTDVIYLGFYYIKNLNKVIDYGTEKLVNMCEKINTTNCYFSDPRNITMPVGWDGVHPTNEGYELLAHRIWDTKLDNDIIFI